MNIQLWFSLLRQLRHYAAPLLLICGLMQTNAAQALTITSCSITTPPSLNFNSYSTTSTNDDTASSQFTITCSVASSGTSTSVTATLSASIGSGTSYSSRTLKNGTSVLNYYIYRDSGRSQILGDGNNGTFTLSTSWTSTGSQSWQSNVYGRIPKNQYSAVPGSYSDTITWTISY